MKLLNTQFSLSSCDFLLLWSKYSQFSVLKDSSNVINYEETKLCANFQSIPGFKLCAPKCPSFPAAPELRGLIKWAHNNLGNTDNVTRQRIASHCTLRAHKRKQTGRPPKSTTGLRCLYDHSYHWKYTYMVVTESKKWYQVHLLPTT